MTTPEGQRECSETSLHLRKPTLQSRSSCGSCSSQQRCLEIHPFPLSAHPGTTAPACPGQCRKPCTGREGCLLQTRPADATDSYRKRAAPGEDLQGKTESTSKHNAVFHPADYIKATETLSEITRREK